MLRSSVAPHMDDGLQLGPKDSNALPNNVGNPTNFSSNSAKIVGVGCAGTKSNVLAANATYSPYSMTGGTRRRRVSRKHRSRKHRSRKHRSRKHRSRKHRSRKHRSRKHRRHSTKHRRHRRRHRTRVMRGGSTPGLEQQGSLVLDSKGYSLGGPMPSGKAIADESALANPPPMHVYHNCPRL